MPSQSVVHEIKIKSVVNIILGLDTRAELLDHHRLITKQMLIFPSILVTPSFSTTWKQTTRSL